jgi:hypothetical protein
MSVWNDSVPADPTLRQDKESPDECQEKFTKEQKKSLRQDTAGGNV